MIIRAPVICPQVEDNIAYARDLARKTDARIADTIQMIELTKKCAEVARRDLETASADLDRVTPVANSASLVSTLEHISKYVLTAPMHKLKAYNYCNSIM